MMLTDTQIMAMAEQGNLVNPYNPELVQPASLEVTLGGDHVLASQDPAFARGPLKQVEKPLPHILQPFTPVVLATTAETIKVPTFLAAQFNGKSSLARLGILVHVTAGFLDPGFTGQITLEIVNLGANPFTLEPGMKIGQVHFMRLDGTVARPYGTAGNHYQGQQGPTASALGATR